MSIKLIFQEQFGTSLNMRIENTKKDIQYSITIGDQNIVLKSSIRPEWDSDIPNILFLQGSAREFNNEWVEIQRKNLKYFLFAIWKYNIEVAPQEDIIWIDNFKYKCKHCGKMKTVRQFHQELFEYCTECYSELKICTSCRRVGATHIFGTDYFCDRCVCLDSFCHICEKDHIVTKEIHVSVEGDYHGQPKILQSCSDCFNNPVALGLEHHYQYKLEQYTFLDYDFKQDKCIKYTSPLNNTLYMGTEIESQFHPKKHTSVVLGKILKLNEKYDFELIYAKHDGTVPDPGSEIVTQPMTLNMFRSLTWKELFDNVIKPTSYGIGGHIHINKTAFISPLHIYKFCKFIRTNIEYIEWIAERSLQQQWCKSHSNNGKVVQIAKQFRKTRNADRYEMINFTADTVELRFFFSPWNAGMLLKNVEFIDALYNYSRDTKLHFDYKEFEDYIQKSCTKYPYLYNFILKRDENKIFKANGEHYKIVNTRLNTSDTLAQPILQPESVEHSVCDWCGETIFENEMIYEGSHYHEDCYDDMLDEIEASPEEEYDYDPTA